MPALHHVRNPLTKTRLYHTARWAFRLYVIAVIGALTYGLVWVADTAGVFPDGYIGTLWASLSALLVILAVVCLPLLFASHAN